MTILTNLVVLVFGLLLGVCLGRRSGSGLDSAEKPAPGVPEPSLASLLDGIDAGVVVVTHDGVIENINHAAQTMMGRTGDVQGESMESIPMGLDILSKMSAVTTAHQSFELKVENEGVIQVRATNRLSGGRVFVLHDISELKHLELMRSDFVANVSHELRTPVSVIRANAETLLDGALEDPAVARDFVSAIHRNSERISNLVADLLDLARLEANSASLVLTDIDVSQIVARTVVSVQTIAQTKNITIHSTLSDDIVCLGDEDSVEQVMTNLIENAVKYGQSDGNVWVRSYQIPGHIRIEVIDDGAGVPPIHRTRLFERFYRVDKGRSRASGGTGLGLSIVKHLITNMNGEVGMEPNQPLGSVFWVTLPLSETNPEFVLLA